VGGSFDSLPPSTPHFLAYKKVHMYIVAKNVMF
jgi:hypothetical protein